MAEHQMLQKEREELEKKKRVLHHRATQLEKERIQVGDSRQALATQTQTLMEMRSQLQKERMELEEEKKRVLQVGAAGLALRAALQQEKEQQRKALVLLQEVEHKLVKRQNALCSFQVRGKVLEMENDLLLREAKDPAGMELGLEEGIRDIFRNDVHCAGREDMAGRNGKLMWLYLKYWRLQVMVQKHRRAEDLFKGSLPK